MNALQDPTKADGSASDRRTSQMHSIRYFLDVFASADPIMRAGAAHYGERLRDQGCDGEEIIRIAATALLVAIEHEIEQRELVLNRLPAIWTEASEGKQPSRRFDTSSTAGSGARVTDIPAPVSVRPRRLGRYVAALGRRVAACRMSD